MLVATDLQRFLVQLWTADWRREEGRHLHHATHQTHPPTKGCAKVSCCLGPEQP